MGICPHRSRAPLALSISRSILGALSLAVALATCARPLPPAAAARPAPAPAAALAAALAHDRPPPAPPPRPAGSPPPLWPENDPRIRPARVVGRYVDSGYETLVVSVEAGACADPWRRGWQVRLEAAPGAPLPWSGVATQSPTPERGDAGASAAATAVPSGAMLTLVIRRLASMAGAPAALHLNSPAGCGGRAGQHLLVQLPETTELPQAPQALSTYLFELGQTLRFGSTFGAFAQARLHALVEERFRAAPPAPAEKPERPAAGKRGATAKGKRVLPPSVSSWGHVPPAGPRRDARDLARLMEVTASTRSLQEMLQRDRRVAALCAADAGSIPIDKLAAVASAGPPPPPWRSLLAALPWPVPTEPLADATPADFYFVRFASLRLLLRALDELPGELGFSASTDTRTDARGLARRYQTELGISRGALASLLADGVAGEVALVGSDPYLADGSDLTLILRAGAGASGSLERALDRAVAAMRAEPGAATHGEWVTTEEDVGGVAARVSRSADGAVHQHRARAAGFELLSTSPGAIRRVLAAIAGRAPRLNDELDFRYLLARDAAAPTDVLTVLGGRFLARISGARHRVLKARRQLALAELETPGLAASLFGWLYGRAPVSVDELLASGLLAKEELAHRRGGGETIDWVPGAPARSSWGTPAALTPLIDLPPAATVTAAERDACWPTAVAPIAVRLALGDAPDGSSIGIDARIMPLPPGPLASLDAVASEAAGAPTGGALAALASSIGIVADTLGRPDDAALNQPIDPLVSRFVDRLVGASSPPIFDALARAAVTVDDAAPPAPTGSVTRVDSLHIRLDPRPRAR